VHSGINARVWFNNAPRMLFSRTLMRSDGSINGVCMSKVMIKSAMEQVRLEIPEGRTACTFWLKAQEAHIVADALSLCETAYNAMQRNIGDKEFLQQEHKYTAIIEQLTEESKELSSKHRDAIGKVYEQGREEALQISAHRLSTLANEMKEIEARHEANITYIKEQSERTIQSLQTELQNIHNQLLLKQAAEATAREEVRQIFQERFDAQATQNTCIMNKLFEEKQEYKELYVESIKEKENIHRSYLQKCEQMHDDNNALMISLRGSSSARGEVGETTVDIVFSSLNLGILEDTSASQGPGNCDRHWMNKYNEISTLSCAVEVKNTQVVKQKADIEKFNTRVQEAVQVGRINAAMFISLQARVPGRDRFELRIEQGIPVLWISRDKGDSDSAASLVEYAFRSMANCWPMLCRDVHRDTEETVLQAVAEHFSTELANLEVLSRQILKLKKDSEACLRDATALQKLHDDMHGNVLRVQTLYPGIVQTHPVAEEVIVQQDTTTELRESPLWQEILNAVTDYHKRNESKGDRGWPTNYNHCVPKTAHKELLDFIEKLKKAKVKVSSFSDEIRRGLKRPASEMES
jgi:hypothetical protein